MMKRFGAICAGVCGAVIVTLSGPVAAQTAVAGAGSNPACAEFRQSIIDMENKSVRPPGWFALDMHLRQLYIKDCITAPSRAAKPEIWHRADGTSTGIETTFVPKDWNYDKDGSYRPEGAAYGTTKEIGEACLKLAGPLTPEPSGRGVVRAGVDPSICALLEASKEACLNPVDSQARSSCKFILGDKPPARPPAGVALPPMTIGLAGGPYNVDEGCSAVLGIVSGNPDLKTVAPDEKARWLLSMQNGCPEFLAAIRKRTNSDPSRDAARFWDALGDLALNGFAPPGSPTYTTAALGSDPGFKKMCDEAKEKRDVCEQRRKDIAIKDTPAGQLLLGMGSQNGAFADCAILYGQIVNMCAANTLAAQKAVARRPLMAPPVPPPAPTPTPAAAAPAPAPAASGGQSAPRPTPVPPALASMSPQCQALLKGLFQSADTGNNAKATEAYGNLRGADCDRQTRELAQAAHTGLPERQMTARGSSIMNKAMQGDRGPLEATIGNRVNEPSGAGYQFGEVLEFAIAIFGMTSGIAVTASALSYVPAAGGNFAARGPGVSRTYGQGSPGTVRPPQSQSTITGTK
jgi:cell division septation protein DedD